VDGQLVAFERLAQVAFELEPVDNPAVH